jgi:hypothetical protein
MNIPTGGTAIAKALYDTHPELVNGNDDQRRELIRLIAETFAARFGPRWGNKKAGPGNPQSKDSLAYDNQDTTFDSWDTQIGATKALVMRDGMPPTYPRIGPPQVFIPVRPIDHVAGEVEPATGTPPDATPPEPPSDVQVQLLAKLLAEVQALRADLKLQMARGFTLKRLR